MQGYLAFLFEMENLIFSILTLLAYGFGFYCCYWFRTLSPRLMVVAAGFAGLFASTILSLLGASLANPDMEMTYIYFIAGNLIKSVSNCLLVVGLWYSLIPIRRRLALSLEPNHGRS